MDKLITELEEQAVWSRKTDIDDPADMGTRARGMRSVTRSDRSIDLYCKKVEEPDGDRR